MRLLILIFLLPPIVLMSSCTSLSPLGDTLDSKHETRLLMFKNAASSENQQEKCEIYSQLSKEKDFTLQHLSLIRAHSVCESTASLLAIAEPPQYLEEEDAERQWIQSLRANNLRWQAEALLRKAKISNRIADKIESLKLAIEKLEQGQADVNDPLLLELTDRLQKVAPRFITDPTAKDYYRIAQDFIYQRDFTKGRQYLQKILQTKKVSFDEEYAARRLLRTSYKIDHDRQAHIIEARKMSEWLAEKKVYDKDLENSLFYARALWTDGKSNSTLRFLERTQKRLAGKINTAEIDYIRGRIFEERRDFKTAIKYYQLGLNQVAEGSTLREKILFSEAWAYRKLGQFDLAAKAFEDLQTSAQQSCDHFKYSYWLARTYRDLGENLKADEAFKVLSQEDSLGFYGLLAFRELGIDIPPLKIEKSKAPWNTAKVDKQTHQTILSLLFVNEKLLLEKFLNSKVQELQAKNSDHETEWLYFLTAYAKAGLYLPLFQQLGSLPSKIKNQLLEKHPDLLFPQQYQEEIKAAAEKYGVRPEWVLALIRQESAFNAQARSPADAIGLMQLLPSVGKKHGKEIGLEVSDFRSLFEPSLNIEVGTYFVSLLQKKYRNQFILATAAYNANEKAIQNWVNTRLDTDPVEFIEEIPYEETKSYVKLVLRNFIFYSRLSQPNQKTPFPRWCLEDLHSFKVSTNSQSVPL